MIVPGIVRTGGPAVPHFMLSWQDAIIIACCLAVAAVIIRRRWGRWPGAVTEAGLLFGLYGLWQSAGWVPLMSHARAMARRGHRSRASVRVVRAVAVRRVVHGDEPRRGGVPGPLAVARRADTAAAQRDQRAADLPALPGADPGLQLVLRHPALRAPGRLPGLALRTAPGRVPGDQEYRRPVHRGEPAHPADPGGAAPAATGHRAGRHRGAVRPVPLLLARRLQRG